MRIERDVRHSLERQSICQTFGIIGRNQPATSRRLEQFRKGTVLRLYNRDPGSQCLEDKQALGIPIDRRHRQHVESLKKSQFASAIDRPSVMKIVA